MTAEKYGFNNVYSSNAWIEPVTGTVMLRPAPLFGTWDTSNSGIYARLTLADFGLSSTAAGWKEVDNRGAGPVRLYNESGHGSSEITTTSYGVNRPFYVSFYTYNVENSNASVFFECGWSAGGTGASGVSLQFRTSGEILIQKDGTVIGGGEIGIEGGQDASNNYASYLIIPFRRRDLLIYSITAGDGFVFTFEDIAEDAVDPEILPDEPFWFYVPERSINVELAPVQFESTGYVTSLPIALASAPEVGETLESRANGAIAASVTNAYVLGDQPEIGGVDTVNVVSAVSVLETDGTSFTPDGAIKTVLLRCDLAGDGQYTPFVYGVHAAYETVFDDTDDAEQFDLTPYILSNPAPVLVVPDDPGGVQFTFTLKAPETLEAGDVAKLLTLGNRPCRVMIGTNVLVDGVLMEPEFEDAFYDEAARLRCTVRDQLYIAQQIQFRERIPLDNVALCETADGADYWNSAVQFIAYQSGIANADMLLDSIGYTIPYRPSNEITEAFQNVIEIGATCYEELARLVGTYAAGFAWGVRPTPSAASPEFYFYDPDNLSNTPDYTLYRTEDDAVAALADPLDVYWSYIETPLAIEANEVRCTGYDPRLGRAVQAYKIDTASQDPTTLPSLRPDNWVGLPRALGIIDPRFNSEDACIRGVEAIYPRVTQRYWTATATSEMLFKATGEALWRGDLLELDGRRSIRISAVQVEFLLEDSSTFVARNAVYTGGTILNRGGANVTEIRTSAERAAVQKTFIYSGGEVIARETPVSTVEVP
jgi:hypothetical protein